MEEIKASLDHIRPSLTNITKEKEKKVSCRKMSKGPLEQELCLGCED